MSENHLIAMNAFRGGNKGHADAQPLSEYDKVIGYPWLHDAIQQIRGEKPIPEKDGDAAKVKSQLPFRCAHYYRFADNKRRQANIIPEAFLYQTTVDVDEEELVETALGMARILDTEEYIGGKNEGEKVRNPWKGMLLHLEYSARKKLHIDIRMPLGMTIEETQRSYCDALGVPCDESCFSPERIIFITDRESEIYRSPGWYAVIDDATRARYREAFAQRGLDVDGRRMRSEEEREKRLQPAEEENKPMPGGAVADAHRTEDGGNQKNLVAFDLFQEKAGLKGVDIDAEGSRHSSLLAIMSAGASRVMGAEALMRAVEARMPSFARERDCRQLIRDFYEKYGDASKPMSRDVRRINAEAERRGAIPVPSSSTPMDEEEEYPAPPPMPGKLPALVGLLVSKTPDIYKPAVANAIFPPLATHLWKTTFRYIDNVDHEATLMCALLAGTGAGKNCVQMPINLIMADIRRRDQENLAREKAWKDEVTRKGANKDKRKRPDNLVIQEIDADMTNPAFVMRTAEAQDHFLYTSLNEIDQFDALKGQGHQQFRIMCLAFDPGNQYGQTRVGTQSVTERVCIRFNWNASTTIHKGQRYFSKVLTDGPVSRINFCTIPEREIGADMPIYGTYDEAFKQALQPYIDNLCRATGRIECPEAYQLASQLKDENADFARMTQSRIYENLSFRANVIAWLKACVLYVANGCQWEEEIADFIRWSERYDLWCKMRFFGDAIAKADVEGVKSSKRGPRNMLQLLPDTFTLHEAEAARLENGLDQKGAKAMLSTWIYRGYIRRKAADGHDNNSYDSFEKLKFRRDGVSNF